MSLRYLLRTGSVCRGAFAAVRHFIYLGGQGGIHYHAVHYPGSFLRDLSEKEGAGKGLGRNGDRRLWHVSAVHEREFFSGKRGRAGGFMRCPFCRAYSGDRLLFAQGGRSGAFLYPVSGGRPD